MKSEKEKIIAWNNKQMESSRTYERKTTDKLSEKEIPVFELRVEKLFL